MTFGVKEMPVKVRYTEMEGTVHSIVTPYPRWKYHATDAPTGIIVDSPEDEASLGAGWVDSPADLGHETAPTVAAPFRRGPGRPRKE
jgi:hypothetical protein